MTFLATWGGWILAALLLPWLVLRLRRFTLFVRQDAIAAEAGLDLLALGPKHSDHAERNAVWIAEVKRLREIHDAPLWRWSP